MEPLVRLTEVSKRYNCAGSAALDGISLSVERGEVLALMGPSGSGKSTMLNLVGGLDKATSGSVVVDGVDLTRLGEATLARFRRTRVGLIFQFFNLLDNLTAFDNVVLPAQLGGAAGREARGRATELLERLGLGGLSDRYPATMSGGERQRVAIARALVNRPALLLADEPTGALDTRSGEQVLDILADLNKTGHTIILVTHDPQLADRCATRTIQLVDGAIVRGRGGLAAVR